jgi:hypothetical protein
MDAKEGGNSDTSLYLRFTMAAISVMFSAINTAHVYTNVRSNKTAQHCS